MTSPVLFESLRWFVATGRWPGRRKRAKWAARRAFEIALRSLGPGDVAVDCGANLGVFTRAMAETGATVHAFEPDPFCFARLVEAFADAPNVRLRNEAVGAADGTVSLYRSAAFDEDPEAKSQSSSLFADKAGMAADPVAEVRRTDLAAFLDDQPRVALLKIDVEGAEVEILEKLFDTGLLSRVGAVFVETHETKLPALAERTAALRARVRAEGLRHVNLDWD